MSVLKFIRQYVRPSTDTPSAATVAPDDHAPTVPTAAVERRAAVRKRARKGTRVLVIDDSKTVVSALTRMLHQNGYEPLHAYDAETGIPLAKIHRPHLIFLDIVLPGMNGFNALRVLRREASMQHMPIIMISGNDQAVEQFYAQRIGADDFMKKPFSREEVFSCIEKLLGPDLIPKRRHATHLSADTVNQSTHQTLVSDSQQTTASPTASVTIASDALQSALAASASNKE